MNILTSSGIISLEVIIPGSVLGFFTVGLKKASRVRFLDMMATVAGQYISQRDDFQFTEELL
jgi:hypothetical protein